MKLSTALAFLLGWQRGLAALLVGLLLAVVVMLVVQKINSKKKKQPFALIPFLSVGALLMFLI
jgi:prepilin signal peptidase PulO-like enzyme (type II secretory pathway)